MFFCILRFAFLFVVFVLRSDETSQGRVRSAFVKGVSLSITHEPKPGRKAHGIFIFASYCDFSRKNFRPTAVGTVTEIWPALVTAGCATGNQELASGRFVLS